MEFSRSVNRMLHDEHMAVIALLGRFGSYLRNQGPDTPPDMNDGSTDAMLRNIASAIDGELATHYAFEEAELFPFLDDAGEGELPAALIEEHEFILPVGRRISALARSAGAEGFSAESWAEFHRLGNLLVHDLTAHAEKEEMGLLPVLEEMLDPELDAKLAGDYAAKR